MFAAQEVAVTYCLGERLGALMSVGRCREWRGAVRKGARITGRIPMLGRSLPQRLEISENINCHILIVIGDHSRNAKQVDDPPNTKAS